MIENFLKNPSAGELSNTKDFHQVSECNIENAILLEPLKYIGRPLSINDGVVVGYNGSSFHCVMCADVGKYGIGKNTASIAISKKGCRWVVSEDGLKNGDLVKIEGSGTEAKFIKALTTEINKAVGKALCNTIKSNENDFITEISFNTDFIKDTSTTTPSA